MQRPLVHTGGAQRSTGRLAAMNQWRKEWAGRIYTATPLTGSVRFQEHLREQNAAYKQAFARLRNNPIGRKDRELRLQELIQWQELLQEPCLS